MILPSTGKEELNLFKYVKVSVIPVPGRKA